MSLNWGVVGLGNHVNQYMSLALKKAKNTNFVAVCSRDISKAKRFAVQNDIKKAFSSLAEMLTDPEIEVIYISTPNKLHTEQAIQCAKSKKHVFCEKPLSTSTLDCLKVISVFKENDVKLGVNYQNRFHPAHIRAKEYIKEMNDNIFLVKAQYCHGSLKGHWTGWRNDPDIKGSGALSSTGLHPIDLLRFTLNSEVIKVRSLLNIKTKYHYVNEMVYLILEFKNGVTGIVISGILVPRSENNLEIYGEKAKIICKNTIGTKLKGQLVINTNKESIELNYQQKEFDLYIRAIEAFNDYILNDSSKNYIANGFNSLNMIKLTNSIINSNKLQRAIKV